MMRRLAMLVVVGVLLVSCADARPDEQAMPAVQSGDPLPFGLQEPPTIRVVEPLNNATVESPFVIRVETENLALAPAGRTRDGEGHWHVLAGDRCLDPGVVIPKDDTHFHVGSGEPTAEVELPPGEHTLCIQVGDGFHVAVAITDVITVTVVE